MAPAPGGGLWASGGSVLWGWDGHVWQQTPGAWCVPTPAAEGRCPGPPRPSHRGRVPRAGCAHVEGMVRLLAVPFAGMPASSPVLGGCCKEITSSLIPRTGKIKGFGLSGGTGAAGTASPAQSKPPQGCARRQR